MTRSVTIGGESYVIDPLQNFQRKCLTMKTDEDLKTYFHYELAHFPLPLFDEAGRRKTKKCVIYDVLVTPGKSIVLKE